MKALTNFINWNVVFTIAKRTFSHAIESPIAYIVAIFFYGFIGGLFGMNFLENNQAAIQEVGILALISLWFVIPILTMGLISDEIRSGTFEQLSTLPIRDWEIVLGKYLGIVILVFLLVLGLMFYPILASFLTDHVDGLDWGGSMGVLVGIFLVGLLYSAIGLFASSLAKNQVVVLIFSVLIITIFFFLGQIYSRLPSVIAPGADFVGVLSHMNTLSRGVWDFRDFFYFVSFIFIFLYFTVQRLSTRRF